MEDHLFYLSQLLRADDHGQQGTVPTYEDMRLLLSTTGSFGTLSLSAGLLHYIERMPEQHRRTTVQAQDGEILMTTTESGEIRPMTPDEIGASAIRYSSGPWRSCCSWKATPRT
ncbi:hypothetical protein [Hymenobacter fodinae]|uniref:Uncharacterized protein n=1 Tax=Hymenobacter fodinae TaxID=2510796 RepID=A0A4Z0P1I1_9BACT|nr:hypothetical protein [Hymenobacter fodinae]TGE04781.1 hypothetical protein EU556_21610 [Hymenobacter fodinae]